MEPDNELVLEKDLDDTQALVRRINVHASSPSVNLPTYVAKSTIPDAGYGLFARRLIRDGELITEYGGRMISVEEIENPDYIYEFPEFLVQIEIKSVLTPPKIKRQLLNKLMEWRGTVVDSRTHFRLSEMGRWANSDETRQNAVMEFMGQNESGEWRIGFIATRDIQPREEIFINYGHKYWGSKRPKCEVCLAPTELMCSETKIPFCSKRCQKKHWSEK